ncbi:NAD(+)/NADH kinase [uncultured Amaricoccus sp.]|nr:NAD(+)/NADH kinase [uncultured Amaricoccus sp.]
MVKVGIIANPISARDIRRVISYAGNLPINDRANIVLRMMAGLATSGVEEVVVMPEHGGIRFQLERNVQREQRLGHVNFPRMRYLDMPVTATPADSARAARMMAEEGVAAIVVLGGDGTNRVVVGACGPVPVAGVSTGTNNAFPELREPTITGLAVGLAATGQVPAAEALRPNKWLEVMLNDRREIALVDVAVVEDRFVGARAIWKAAGFRDLFVTFGLPQAIGMSAIAGLSDPVDRATPEGRHICLSPDAPRQLLAPIAPGLIDRVGIVGTDRMMPGVAHHPSVAAGSLAFDGERELTFTDGDRVSVRLVPDAFRTIDVPACMAHAASAGLFVRNPD